MNNYVQASYLCGFPKAHVIVNTMSILIFKLSIIRMLTYIKVYSLKKLIALIKVQ